MSKIIKIIYPFFLLTISVFYAAKALAVCPVCTAGVVVGLGLSRWLGIDDTVTGLWIGGLLASLTLWTINWFNKKKWHFLGSKLIITVFFYASISIPLYWMQILLHPLNRLWGFDKLLLGIIIGTGGFLTGLWLHNFLKRKRKNRSIFAFQKVILPIIPLIILSLIFYYITK